MDWTRGGCHEGRGVFSKYGVSKKSSYKLNETKFSIKKLLLTLFYTITKFESIKMCIIMAQIGVKMRSPIYDRLGRWVTSDGSIQDTGQGVQKFGLFFADVIIYGSRANMRIPTVGTCSTLQHSVFFATLFVSNEFRQKLNPAYKYP